MLNFTALVPLQIDGYIYKNSFYAKIDTDIAEQRHQKLQQQLQCGIYFVQMDKLTYLIDANNSLRKICIEFIRRTFKFKYMHCITHIVLLYSYEIFI